MKVFFLYLVIGMAIIVTQTTVLTIPVFEGLFYDLLIPVVLFVRLNMPVREGVIVVLALGVVMDLFSGGTFGLYLTVYFWTFIGVQGISSFFHVRGSLFLSLLIGLCVFVQNIFFCIFAVFPAGLVPALSAQIGVVIWQTLFGAATGPALIKSLERLLRHMKKIGEENNGTAGKDWISS
jgi:cell shape-determining protein MreD